MSYHTLMQCKQQIGNLKWGDTRHNNITHLDKVADVSCFTSENHDAIERRRIVEGSRNFYHMGFFNVHNTAQSTNLQCFAHAAMQQPWLGFNPVTFGSEAECPRH